MFRSLRKQMPVPRLVVACTLSYALALAPVDQESTLDGSLEGVSHQRPAVRQRHIGRALAALRDAPNTQDPAQLLQQAEINEGDDDDTPPVPAVFAAAAADAKKDASTATAADAAADAKKAGGVAAAADDSTRSGLMRREVTQNKVPCVWASWGEWFPCTLSCGGGYQARWRDFLTYPQGGGEQCTGTGHELKNCNMHRCFSTAVDGKINCNWGAWSEWGVCSETCGGGMQETIRMVATFPQNGGANCVGQSRKYQSCYPQIACPQTTTVDCEWGEWNDWEGCSVACGNGSRTSWRKVNVHPQNGGKECLGEIRRSEICTGLCNTVDCVWGPWSGWGSCSKTCGSGVQQSFRAIGQFPQSEGKACEGVPWQEQACNTQVCPPVALHCAWSEWQQWGDCSRTCGGGVRNAMREIFRHPQNGGEECLGSYTRSHPCAMKACPDPRIDCEWGDWAVWTGCSKSCDGGMAQTARMVMVYPQFGGANCEGDRQMMRLCNTRKCSDNMIDCLWGAWSEWKPCTRTCGNGTTEAFRDIDTFPQNGGSNCEGKGQREQACYLKECTDRVAINCSWGMWAGWEPCSKSCGGGTQRSWREVAVHPQNGGEECAGSMMRWQECGTQVCFGANGQPLAASALAPLPGADQAVASPDLVAKRVREVTSDAESVLEDTVRTVISEFSHKPRGTPKKAASQRQSTATAALVLLLALAVAGTA